MNTFGMAFESVFIGMNMPRVRVLKPTHCTYNTFLT